MQSIISRWPKQPAAQRSTRSRSMPQCASMMLNDASLQIAPKSPRWLAMRSSLRHHAAQPNGTWWRYRCRAQTSTARAKAKRVGDRAVARGAAGKTRCLLQRHAVHQMVDALVHVAEALFQPNHRFAISGEAEMARLDDAGVNRADGNLVQAFAFHRQEWIGGRIWTMIEPRARVGQSDRIKSEQIARRAFQADGGCMKCANGRVAVVRAVQAEHDNAACRARPCGPGQARPRG